LTEHTDQVVLTWASLATH